MKLKDAGATVALIIVGLAVLAGLTSSKWLGHDNAVEEAAEEIIESQTGLDIDLTPRKPKTVLLLETERYKNIKNFADHIGFNIKRKQKKLEFCLSDYKRKGLRSYSNEFKLEVLAMVSEGISRPLIGDLLNFNYTNIYDFEKQYEKGLLS